MVNCKIKKHQRGDQYKMSNINVVQSCWNFAQLKEIKKLASSHNLKSLSQKTKIWCNNHPSRRFGKYSFQYAYNFDATFTIIMKPKHYMAKYLILGSSPCNFIAWITQSECVQWVLPWWRKGLSHTSLGHHITYLQSTITLLSSQIDLRLL